MKKIRMLHDVRTAARGRLFKGQEYEVEDSLAQALIGFRDAELAKETLPAPEAAALVVTPNAVELAAKFGVDLHQVAGSGSGGKILVKDVEAAIRSTKMELGPSENK